MKFSVLCRLTTPYFIFFFGACKNNSEIQNSEGAKEQSIHDRRYELKLAIDEKNKSTAYFLRCEKQSGNCINPFVFSGTQKDFIFELVSLDVFEKKVNKDKNIGIARNLSIAAVSGVGGGMVSASIVAGPVVGIAGAVVIVGSSLAYGISSVDTDKLKDLSTKWPSVTSLDPNKSEKVEDLNPFLEKIAQSTSGLAELKAFK